MSELKICGFGQELPQRSEEEVESKPDAVFVFDSGASLNAQDAQAHVMVTGITGAGKTMAAGVPILEGALKTGAAAFIADHKGNLRKIARKICKIVGRESDIYEVGTGELATPLNLLEGMPEHQVRQLFSLLMRRVFQGRSGNMDFHEKGVDVALDIVVLLRFLHEVRPDYFPTANLALVAEIMQNEKAAFDMYLIFKKNYYDENNEKHYKFVRKVEGGPFHILHAGERQASGSMRAEQMSYTLAQIKLAFNRFLEIPVLVDNFAAEGSGISFADALEKRKIILFRLDPGIGPIGEDLCRIMIESWYEAIIARGTENAIPSFTFLDEFQSICNLSSQRFSDRRFVAESREFKAAVAVLTQNVAGLPGSNEDKLNLVHNLNTKIMLYNSDPDTSAAITPHTGLARMRDGEPDILTTLDRGEAYVIRYDSETGKHVAGKETCNKAHDRLKAALEAISDEDIYNKDASARSAPVRRSLLHLIKYFTPRAPEPQKEENKEEVKETVSYEKRAANEPKKISKEQEIVRRIMEKENWRIAAHSSNDVIFKMPKFFTENAVIEFPAGWMPVLENVLRAIKESDLSLRIHSLKIDNNKLDIEFDDGVGAAKELFKSLIQKVACFCPVCGKCTQQVRRRSELLWVCGDCMRKFKLDGDEENTSTHEIMHDDEQF